MTVYVVRQGGLGNQLFQLAAAMSLDDGGGGCFLPGDRNSQLSIEELAPNLTRAFGWRDRWKVGEPSPSPNPVQRVVEKAGRHRMLRARQRVGRETFRQNLDHFSGAFVPRDPSLTRPEVLVGYFQHPDWYTASVPTLVDRLLAAAPKRFAIDWEGPTVLNVRGGDYETLGWSLPDAYYLAAVSELAPRSISVVSDDSARGEQLAALLVEAGWVVEPARSGTDAIDDFWTIAAAPSVIMSNSTFSWWAVVVGDELHRRRGVRRAVVAPASWIKGHGGVLLRPEWRALE